MIIVPRFSIPVRILTLLLLLGFISAIDSKQNESVSYGDIFIETSIGDAIRLNPIIATDSASGEINSFVFNGLVRYDKNIKLEPDLAESWTVSEDGLEIVFKLRRNVKWHDGYPFTAKDVEFTYKCLIDPKVATPYSSSYQEVEKFEIIDAYTVRIKYKKPFAPCLSTWGMGIIPHHLLKNKDINNSDFNRHPVGTGPYIFNVWKTSQKIVLTANPNYYEGRPYIDKFIYRIIPNQTVAFLELLSGSIDTMGLTPDQFALFTKNRRFTSQYVKYRYPTFSYTYVGYNLLRPLFADKRIRIALDYAINKQEIIDGIMLGLGHVCTGHFPPNSWAYNSNVKPRGYNPQKAKQILSELGWKDTDGDGILDKNGTAFKFTLITNLGNVVRKQCAEIIQQQLKKVGVSMDISIVEWGTFVSEYVNKKNFDVLILGWGLDPEPDCFDIWHSTKTNKHEYNFVSYKNEEVDKLLVEGRRTFDYEKRKKIYNRIHEILADDVPYTFLYVPDSLVALSNRFRGIKVEPLGIRYNFIKWYVPKHLQKYRTRMTR